MKNILAIDSSTEILSVALQKGKAFFSKTENVGHSHSTFLLPWVNELLNEAQITLKDIDFLVFGAGPGAFTGVRLACACVQGLAFGLDKLVFPMNNLRAMAASEDFCGTIAVLNDARMNECYGCVYEKTPNEMKALTQNVILKPQAVNDWLTEQKVQLAIGNAFYVYPIHPSIPTKSVHFDALFLLKALEYEPDIQSQLKDASEVAPLYIRNNVALTIKERQEGKRL